MHSTKYKDEITNISTMNRTLSPNLKPIPLIRNYMFVMTLVKSHTGYNIQIYQFDLKKFGYNNVLAPNLNNNGELPLTKDTCSIHTCLCSFRLNRKLLTDDEKLAIIVALTSELKVINFLFINACLLRY